MDLLTHLETFVSVAEQRSFSRAADHLRIAQPLLSRRVKNLEHALGGELFDRSHRQLGVTPFGALLLPHAQDVLSRTRHLRAVAQAARTATVHGLGVPPECDPEALARVLRAAATHGVSVAVHEAPAPARAAALAAGIISIAVARVPAGTAPLIVVLGVASAEPLEATNQPAVHLDTLRPRRGARGAPDLLLLPEDDVPGFTERLDRAMARAGMTRSRARVASAASAAAAEVLAGAGLLICDGPFARRHGLSWRPLADATLHRGYEVAFAPGRFGATTTHELSGWLPPLLANAVGAARSESAGGGSARGDARASLATHA